MCHQQLVMLMHMYLLVFKFVLLVLLAEIRDFRDIGVWEMVQEECALPIHVLYFSF